MPQEDPRLRKVWSTIKTEQAAAEIAGTPIGYAKLNARARALSEGRVKSLAELEQKAGVNIDDSLLSGKPRKRAAKQEAPRRQAARDTSLTQPGDVPTDSDGYTLRNRYNAIIQQYNDFNMSPSGLDRAEMTREKWDGLARYVSGGEYESLVELEKALNIKGRKRLTFPGEKGYDSKENLKAGLMAAEQQDDPEAARERIRQFLIDEGKLPPEPLSPAQNMALAGYGMSFGQSPRIAGGLAAAGNLLSDPRGAYQQAHDINAQYMYDAFAQNPEAARNQTRFGGAVSTAATLGKIAGPRPPVTGPRGLPGTLKWGAEGAALGEGGLSGAGGTLRWGGMPLTAAALEYTRLPQQVPPGTAQLPPPDPRQAQPMPQDAARVAPQPRQNTQFPAAAGTPPALMNVATGYAASPEGQANMAEQAELERQADAQMARMGGPGRNVAGNAGPGVIMGPTALAGKGIMDLLPGAGGDIAAVADVGRDLLRDEVGLNTALAAASLLPLIPNLRTLKAMPADEGMKWLEEVAPDLAKKVDPEVRQFKQMTGKNKGRMRDAPPREGMLRREKAMQMARERLLRQQDPAVLRAEMEAAEVRRLNPDPARFPVAKREAAEHIARMDADLAKWRKEWPHLFEGRANPGRADDYAIWAEITAERGMAAVLRKEGYVIENAEDFRAALKAFNAKQPEGVRYGPSNAEALYAGRTREALAAQRGELEWIQDRRRAALEPTAFPAHSANQPVRGSVPDAATDPVADYVNRQKRGGILDELE